jgi:hypothetical protein
MSVPAVCVCGKWFNSIDALESHERKVRDGRSRCRPAPPRPTRHARTNAQGFVVHARKGNRCG